MAATPGPPSGTSAGSRWRATAGGWSTSVASARTRSAAAGSTARPSSWARIASARAPCASSAIARSRTSVPPGPATGACWPTSTTQQACIARAARSRAAG
ncbi:hypothetical protein [Actinomycetospora sp. CA-053990]|uniref:hypothetical protein n=1 Tax=Actinomycetospora sp. CA-053990 TaxID=3239891 RepID=UPI003D8EF38E